MRRLLLATLLLGLLAPCLAHQAGGRLLLPGQPKASRLGSSAIGLALATGLQVWYGLDEATGNTARVDQVQGWNLTAAGSPTQVSGRCGTGTHFASASTQWLTHANGGLSSDPWNVASRSFSVAVVWNPDSVAAGTEGVVYRGDMGGSHQPWMIYRGAANVSFGVGDLLLVASTNDDELVAGVDNLIFAWWDAATHIAHLQVNGGFERTATNVGISLVDRTTDVASVGRYYGGYGNSALKRLAKWDRVLTTTERFYLLNGLRSRTYSQVSSVGVARMTTVSASGTLYPEGGLAAFVGFCDLCYSSAQSAYFGVFRTGALHGYSATSNLKVVKCPVGSSFTSPGSWSVVATLVSPDGTKPDVRDPKIRVRPSDDELEVWTTVTNVGSTAYVAYVFQSATGATWDGGTACTGLTANDWPWRFEWGPNGTLYSIAYTALVDPVTTRLYSSADGVAFTKIVDPLDGPNEASEGAILWRTAVAGYADSQAVITLRQDGTTYNRMAGPVASPYNAGWTFTNTWPKQPSALCSRVAAPVALELPDARKIVAGRTYTPGQRNALLWLEEETKSLVEVVSFDANQADCGYPGMVYSASDQTLRVLNYNDIGVRAYVVSVPP